MSLPDPTHHDLSRPWRLATATAARISQIGIFSGSDDGFDRSGAGKVNAADHARLGGHAVQHISERQVA